MTGVVTWKGGRSHVMERALQNGRGETRTVPVRGGEVAEKLGGKKKGLWSEGGRLCFCSNPALCWKEQRQLNEQLVI